MIRPNPTESKGSGPAAEAGEEVTLVESIEVVGDNVGNGSVIDDAIGYQPLGNQIAQPAHAVRIDLVIVRCHFHAITGTMRSVKFICLGARLAHAQYRITPAARAKARRTRLLGIFYSALGYLEVFRVCLSADKLHTALSSHHAGSS